MAPSSQPQSSSAAARQDAVDVKINQTVFGFALAAGALIVLGAVAYICFVVVGRYRRQHVDTGGQSADTTVEVEEAGKVPRRMILSPLFQLPVYDLEEPDKSAFTEHAGHSWRASLHAMGVMGAVHVSRTVEIKEEDEDDVPLASRQATLKESLRFTSPSSNQAVDDVTNSPDSSLDSPTVETPTISYVLPAAVDSPQSSTIVEVIRSQGSTPNIIVEDYAPHLRFCIGSPPSSVYSDDDTDDKLLQVPPMSWNAPRDCISVSSTEGSPKQIKKKSSITKLVSVFGDISNAIRLRPSLPSSTVSPKKGLKRSITRDAAHRKENSVRSI